MLHTICMEVETDEELRTSINELYIMNLAMFQFANILIYI